MRGPALTFLALLVGCAPPVPNTAVSVREAVDHIHAWNGKDVIVDGWLGNCRGMDCALYPTLADAQLVSQGSGSAAWDEAMDRRLSIGADKEFDRLAAPLQFAHVRIGGRLNDICRSWMTSCTDRVPDIQAISINLADHSKKAD